MEFRFEVVHDDAQQQISSIIIFAMHLTLVGTKTVISARAEAHVASSIQGQYCVAIGVNS